MTTKCITNNVQIDNGNRVLVLDTDEPGTYGVYRGQAVRNGEVIDGEWHVWLETNGDPAMIPHPSDEEALQDWLDTAGISREQFDAAIGDVEWWS